MRQKADSATGARASGVPSTQATSGSCRKCARSSPSPASRVSPQLHPLPAPPLSAASSRWPLALVRLLPVPGPPPAACVLSARVRRLPQLPAARALPHLHLHLTRRLARLPDARHAPGCSRRAARAPCLAPHVLAQLLQRAACNRDCAALVRGLAGSWCTGPQVATSRNASPRHVAVGASIAARTCRRRGRQLGPRRALGSIDAPPPPP